MIYARKPQLVNAERVDLKDIVQMARLLISVYETPFGLRGSVVSPGGGATEVKTGDWVLRPVADTAAYATVMSDADFRSTYSPAEGDARGA